VDVSGSGITAGPRALLLSGAVGGLLATVPPDEFLPAANDYLTRQRWSLGFASAIYLQLNLRTGEYSVRAAGHPPALHFAPQQAPVWQSVQASGTVLGVLPELTGTAAGGVIRPGDALLLYTDGVIEDRSKDLDAGTSRLRDSVEQLALHNHWDGMAARLVDLVPALQDDDRTVVVIRRAPVPAEAAGSATPVAMPGHGPASASSR
ncbi:MAG TPA: PP2C family protein-serine/threonine phosphatase, partial [Jatrophihabitans sp.]|nr:PP2C family protein-serine/threonine phosphatase [Jatrophihabitans sp.]